MNQLYREAVVLPLDQYEKLIEKPPPLPQIEDNIELCPLAKMILNHAQTSSYFNYDKSNGNIILNGKLAPRAKKAQFWGR